MATNTVFKIAEENNNFPISRLGRWFLFGNERTVIGLNRLLELKSQNDVEIQVEVSRKRENQIIVGDNEYY